MPKPTFDVELEDPPANLECDPMPPPSPKPVVNALGFKPIKSYSVHRAAATKKAEKNR